MSNIFFFFNDTATTEIYTLSLHALFRSNYRNERKLSGTEYGIQPGTAAHKKFVKGNLEVWVRGLVNGKWTKATIITIDLDRKSTRLNSSHSQISYAVFCLKKKTR